MGESALRDRRHCRTRSARQRSRAVDAHLRRSSLGIRAGSCQRLAYGIGELSSHPLIRGRFASHGKVERSLQSWLPEGT
jgi:hypothetical protein